MISACLRYLRSVLRHKWYVFLECLKFGLIWQGIIHDWTKFLPWEFFPYAIYFEFYKGVEFKPRWAEEAFNAAWNHHQKHNPHHWQYYILTMDRGDVHILEMPKKYRQEMIADWRGAGRSYATKENPYTATSTRDWYLERVNIMRLHPTTRMFVELELRAPLSGEG